MSNTNPPRRRQDLAMEAIVKAAIKLQAKLGYDATYQFLVDAEVPLEVINRVLGDGPYRPSSSV
jgi:hypothetical protein